MSATAACLPMTAMVPLSKQRNGSAGPSPPQPPPDELRRVDVDGFPEQDGDVFLFSQDVAKRSGDLAGAENPRGHLVQKGLKEVKILLIDQCYRNILAA